MLIIIITIFILVILITISISILYKNKCKNVKDTFLNSKKTLCIYMYTFGKKHTKHHFTKKIINYYPNTDLYVYTDNIEKVSFLYDYKKNFKSLNIIKVPIIEKNYDFIDNNRLTTKYYKFKIIPEEIKKYDYMYHLDFGRLDYLNILTESYLQLLINNITHKTLLLAESPRGSIGFDHDIKTQLRLKQVSKENLNKYLLQLDKNIYNYKHPEMSNFIRDLKDDETNNIFEKIYDELVLNKITRDQLIFTNTLLKYNFNMNKIKFIKIFQNWIDIFFIKNIVKYLIIFNLK